MITKKYRSLASSLFIYLTFSKRICTMSHKVYLCIFTIKLLNFPCVEDLLYRE